MAAGRESVAQDYIIERVQHLYQCRILWSEGRPCLEYSTYEELDRITDYIKKSFDIELLDVFFYNS